MPEEREKLVLVEEGKMCRLLVCMKKAIENGAPVRGGNNENPSFFQYALAFLHEGGWVGNVLKDLASKHGIEGIRFKWHARCVCLYHSLLR